MLEKKMIFYTSFIKTLNIKTLTIKHNELAAFIEHRKQEEDITDHIDELITKTNSLNLN